MSPYLTDEEIAFITRPLTQGAARIRYIRREYGLPVQKRPDGQPLVWRVDAERRGVPLAPRAANDERPVAGPNWAAMGVR